jgi:hypothetical protein
MLVFGSLSCPIRNITLPFIVEDQQGVEMVNHFVLKSSDSPVEDLVKKV